MHQRLSPFNTYYNEQICSMGTDCAVVFFSQRNGAMAVETPTKR